MITQKLFFSAALAFTMFSSSLAIAQAPTVAAASLTSDRRVEVKLSSGKSTVSPTVANQSGVADIKISSDRSTVAWINLVDTNGSSSAPVAMTIYRGGKFASYEPGMGIYGWYFVNSGRRIVTVQGPLRGESTPTIVLTGSESAQDIASWKYGKPARPSWAIPAKLKAIIR